MRWLGPRARGRAFARSGDCFESLPHGAVRSGIVDQTHGRFVSSEKGGVVDRDLSGNGFSTRKPDRGGVSGDVDEAVAGEIRMKRVKERKYWQFDISCYTNDGCKISEALPLRFAHCTNDRLLLYSGGLK